MWPVARDVLAFPFASLKICGHRIDGQAVTVSSASPTLSAASETARRLEA
jgi:hypothetical protein